MIIERLRGIMGELVKPLRMAGVMLLALALGFALSSSSLSNAPRQEPPQPTEVRVSTADDGRQVQLREGQVLVVSLEANPSTGYTWQVADSEEGAEGEWILREAGPIEFQPASTLLGAPGTQILRFHALAEGHDRLRLEYRRPWEGEAEPAGVFSLEVQAVGPFKDASSAPTARAAGGAVDSSILTKEQPQLDLPSAFNWCDFGGCTPIKDQGLCGSCWAFGTVGPLELNLLIDGGLVEDLSEQYLLSCNTEFWGCDGGWWAHDYHAWKVPPGESGAGAVVEADFPYVARDDPCNPPHPHHHKVDSWQYVGSTTSVPAVTAIKQAIYEHGPVSAAVCVNAAFQSYSGGVFLGPGCANVNHAIVLAGWDDNQGLDGVWFLRNSWGPGWGESGYMRIGYGVSSVGFSANYVEYFSSNCYNLTVKVSPGGAGTITIDPPPNCEADGYEPGTEVDLTVSSNSGWHFAGWSGAASGDGHTASVTMDSHKSVTAHLSPDWCVPWFLLPLPLAAWWVGRVWAPAQRRNGEES